MSGYETQATWVAEDEFQGNTSEFGEAYDDDRARAAETFSAELLEETLEVLGPSAPVCVGPTALVSDVVDGMASRNHGCVLVKEGERLVGIFTERDVLRRVLNKVDMGKTSIGEVMTRDPEAVSFHDTIAAALNKMTIGGFRHVPLVDIERHPVGVVSVKDIVEFFVEHFSSRVLNVAPDPSTRNPDQAGGAG